MERRNFLALMGNTAFGALARRMGLRTAPDNPKTDIEIHITPSRSKSLRGKSSRPLDITAPFQVRCNTGTEEFGIIRDVSPSRHIFEDSTDTADIVPCV
jgi:hypothetical protein